MQNHWVTHPQEKVRADAETEEGIKECERLSTDILQSDLPIAVAVIISAGIIGLQRMAYAKCWVNRQASFTRSSLDMLYKAMRLAAGGNE